jgi:hypothetical protein
MTKKYNNERFYERDEEKFSKKPKIIEFQSINTYIDMSPTNNEWQSINLLDANDIWESYKDIWQNINIKRDNGPMRVIHD